MATARNWLATLWSASYKGVPFFVERDNEQGSRRIVEHEFPMRDDPFLEDLGEGVRRYNVTAYVASDSADAEASAVMQICATRGPGILVLPTHGPVLVRCLEFERDRSKDKHGYIAHSLRFSRDGAAHSLISNALLSNLTFMAVDNLAVQVASTFASGLLTVLQPDFVIAAAADVLQDATATIEMLRTSFPVEATISAAQRTEIAALYDAIPTLIEDPNTVATVPARIMAAMRAIGDGIVLVDPAVAVQAFDEVVQANQPQSDIVIAATYPTPFRRNAALNADQAARVLQSAAAGAYAEAVVQAPLSDRPQAITLRANTIEYLDALIESLPAGDFELARALAAVRDATVNYLSRSILDLAPVVHIEASLSVPSLYWAWRLYKDPARASEIVDRNRLPHPSFVPLNFEALSK